MKENSGFQHEFQSLDDRRLPTGFQCEMSNFKNKSPTPSAQNELLNYHLPVMRNVLFESIIVWFHMELKRFTIDT